MPISNRILRRLLMPPFRTAIVDDQSSWSAFSVWYGSMHIARAIAKTSQRPHVGIILPTSGLFPVAALGTWRLGRTIVPLNYLLKSDDLHYVIDDAELDTIVTVQAMLDHFGPLPDHVNIIRMEDVNFRAVPPLQRAKTQRPENLATLLYTSGTSGKPKGVMLTAGNLDANVRQCTEWAGFNSRDIVLGVLPQFHSFGLTVLTLLPLAVGCQVVYTARFAPRRLLDLLQEYRPTTFIAIPSMYNALLNAKSAKAEHFASLRFIVSGGEPLPEAVFRGFQERFGVIINEGYGLTETGPVTNWCRPQEHKLKSVGKALPHVRERIVDSDGNELGPNEDGEIRVAGPNIMKGYFKLPAESEAAFDEKGYFKTGDMGHIDDEGHLFITGRIKEMLIIGGENVFPREIEEVLNNHGSVLDSAVIGMLDESRGEVPLAFVELSDGAAFDETALRAHCREFLPQYKVPREIRAVEALPRNPTGKILRRELKEAIAT